MDPQCFSECSCECELSPRGLTECERGILFLSLSLFCGVSRGFSSAAAGCWCPRLCDVRCDIEYR